MCHIVMQLSVRMEQSATGLKASPCLQGINKQTSANQGELQQNLTFFLFSPLLLAGIGQCHPKSFRTSAASEELGSWSHDLINSNRAM